MENNPVKCAETEDKITEILQRDRFKDQDSITAINILDKKVCSVITNFSSGIG